jgi:TetR/AcrR family transcriptional regulator of autoinduction and epiphytic fitness
MSSGTDTSFTDGRVARGERMIQLVDESRPVRARELAQRASVSVRAIFNHFGDLEALSVAAADTQIRRLLAQLPPPGTHDDLEARASAIVADHATVAERMLPMRVLFLRWDVPSNAATDYGRAVLRRRSEITLAHELGTLLDEDRRELLSAIQATTDIDVWAALRRLARLDVTQAEQVWRRLVIAVMRDALGGGYTARQGPEGV